MGAVDPDVAGHDFTVAAVDTLAPALLDTGCGVDEQDQSTDIRLQLQRGQECPRETLTPAPPAAPRPPDPVMPHFPCQQQSHKSSDDTTGCSRNDTDHNRYTKETNR